MRLCRVKAGIAIVQSRMPRIHQQLIHQLIGAHVESVRIGVAHAEVQPVGNPLVQRRLQRVVVGVFIVGEVLDRRKIGELAVIGRRISSFSSGFALAALVVAGPGVAALASTIPVWLP